MQKYSLAFGGLVGSFISSCIVASGSVGVEHVIYALFVISITSCIALILDLRKSHCDGIGEVFSIGLQGLDSIVRIGFGAGLAATFIYGFSQFTNFVSQYFSMPLMTSAIISTLLLTSYLSFIALMILIGKNRTARQEGYFGY